MALAGAGQVNGLLAALAPFLLLFLSACDPGSPASPHEPPVQTTGLGPEHLGLIVNIRDPLSVKIADYYIDRRQIPPANVLHVSFKPGNHVMRPEDFHAIRARVEQQTPASVQVYALAWTVPFRVGCMSITTAFAAGFDAGFCAAACSPTRTNPYFDSHSRRPRDDFDWRPSMLLAGQDLQSVKALIDRGVAADGSMPAGTGYLVSSSDRARNVRARYYNGIRLMQSDRFRLQIISRDTLQYRDDILFYFTGLARVDKLETNIFLPGAIADHLTSAGGRLDSNGRQMSSLRWLQAGASGSYGAVAEPCNFPQKFPRPDIVIDRYLDGETLIEAYWKSVEWPGQGVFIGEPLAAPFSTTAQGS
jgi:uncharacterized protein (TIGR03790 family)